jgi:plasmid stability protein
MPALIMDNIPSEIYEMLQRWANARHRSVQDEAVDLLQRGLREEGFGAVPRLPDLIIGEEISPPCDLPRPEPSAPMRTHPGKPRVPDLLA